MTMSSITNAATEPAKAILGLPRRMRRLIGAHWRTANFARQVSIDSGTQVLTIGDLAYGGYQIPAGLLDEHSVVLSAGAGTDVSFESILVDRYGCRIHLLDPVPESGSYVAVALANEPRISFEQAALWNAETKLEFHEPVIQSFVSHSATNMHDTPVSFLADARTVGSLRAEHGWERIDLLKISAEGSEFAILDAVLAAHEPITAMLVEFAQPVPISRVQNAIHRLATAGYRAVACSARPFNWKMTFVRS